MFTKLLAKSLSTIGHCKEAFGLKSALSAIDGMTNKNGKEGRRESENN